MVTPASAPVPKYVAPALTVVTFADPAFSD